MGWLFDPPATAQPGSGNVQEDVGVVGGFLTTSGDVNLSSGNDANAWNAQTIAGLYGSSLTIENDGVWTYTAENANPSIQALNTGQSLTEVFTVSTVSNGSTTITINIEGLDEPPCFVSGTLIDTPYGPRPVEDLREGDIVLTRDNGPKPLLWSGSRNIDPSVSPHSSDQRLLSPRGVPERDVLVSPMHRIVVSHPAVDPLCAQSEVFCSAKSLVNGVTIFWEPMSDVCYHHLLFNRHEVVMSSGCESESFYPGDVGLEAFDAAAREEVLRFFPELRSLGGAYGPTARMIARHFEAISRADVFRPQDQLTQTISDRVA